MDIPKHFPEQLRPHMWKPGVSGNPSGLKKGTRHFETLFKEAIKKVAAGEQDTDAELIVKKVISKAKEGDLHATEMVMDRTDGKLIAPKDEESGININVVVLNFDAYRNSPQSET